MTNPETKQTVELKKNDWVEEGALVRSEDKSFVKFLFTDKTSVNLGPSSQIEIKEFSRQKAGIVNLLKGKVRSVVSKNYGDIDKSGSKFFIKTRSAAMGVRGTDFQVTFNPRNKVTSLLTFEGAVAMTKLDERVNDSKLNQRTLDTLLNSSNAVMVRQGQFSGTLPGQKQVTIPVKISPNQLESLKNNVDMSSNDKTSDSGQEKKQTRSIVPKGLDAKKVTKGSASVVAGAMKNAIGSEKAGTVISATKVSVNSNNPPQLAPPEGMVDAKTGAYAPPAGGFLDDKTGLYIPPTEDSSFDSNAGVYVPSPTVGSVDPDTGAYVPPSGVTLSDNGEFISKEGRGPASVNGPKSIGSVVNESIIHRGGPEKGNNLEVDALAQDFKRERLQDFNNKDASTEIRTRSRVEFNISR